jgi:hypothetical protein
MAKITFKRSGGFIGEPLRVELNLNSLPIHAVRNITRLVEEAQFFDLPENLIKHFNHVPHRPHQRFDHAQLSATVSEGIVVTWHDSTGTQSRRCNVTKINFKRTGGVLGKEIDTDIDLNEIPDADSQQVMQLITESNFFKIPQNLIAQAIPDEYEYTVTIEAGNTHHTIQTSDSSAPESLRPLLEKLSRLARSSNTPTAE